MSDDDMPMHQVAITFFVTSPGVDVMDAADRAIYSIYDQLRKDGRHGNGNVEIPSYSGVAGSDRKLELPVTRVIYAMEAGSAMGNGYLYAKASNQAWRMFDRTYKHPVDDD